MCEYILTIKRGSGIGSALMMITSALYYLDINNINQILFINLDYSAKCVKLLFDNFIEIENITPLKFINSQKIEDNKKNTNVEYKELFGIKDTLCIYQNIKKNINVNKYINKFISIWKLKQNIIDECSLLNNYDIALHIRRGDKVTLEPHLPVTDINTYIDKIVEIGIVNPKIFHSSDEYNTLLELKDKKPELNISSFCSENDDGFDIREIDNKSDSYVIENINKLIKELHIMKTSTYFLGVKASNIGYIVFFLREAESKTNTIFLDR